MEVDSGTKTREDKVKTIRGRLDMFNTPILKKVKAHRVVFRDQICKNTSIADVNIVENWKKYNIITDSNAGSGCTCHSF